MPARKAEKSLLVPNEDVVQQNYIWRFFGGDRLAYLVIVVAVGVGITVFFALSKVTDINTQSELLVLNFFDCNELSCYCCFSWAIAEIVA